MTAAIAKRLGPVLVLTAICWAVYLADSLIWNGTLNQHGIVPRRLGGLPGILWAPFLHSSLRHLLANTLPLLILGGILCARSRSEFAFVALAGTVLGGALTWLIAREASHVGASGLVFCFFGYLGSLAFFNRTVGSLALSVVCLVVYGGMLRGVLPTSSAVSWESHAAGLAAGITLAWLRSKVDQTAKATQPAPPTRPASPAG